MVKKTEQSKRLKGFMSARKEEDDNIHVVRYSLEGKPSSHKDMLEDKQSSIHSSSEETRTVGASSSTIDLS